MATTSAATTSTGGLSTATAAALASTPAAVAAANKASAQKLVTSLGAGSGVDVSALAQNLVDAERVPKENEINTKISKNEARISGFSALSFVLSQVNTAAAALKDQNSFNSLSATNTNTSAFSATPGANALAGSHEIEVLHVAKAQRTVSNGLLSAGVSLNGGKAMTLSLNVGDVAKISPTVSTVQGVAAATETSAVTFQPLQAGQTVTVAGLTYHANVDSTAEDIATAFADLADGAINATPDPVNGFFTGALTGFHTSTNTQGVVTFTSASMDTDVSDISIATSLGATAPVVVTTQGVQAGNEYSAVTFKDMVAGQSVTIAGLTYTSTGVTAAADVASAFASLTAGPSTPSNPATGTFSGALSGFNSTGSTGTSTLYFSSVSAGVNVTDITTAAASARISVPDGRDTPQDIVNAINASTSSGVKAQLVYTGDTSGTPYQIVLTGAQGATNAFTLATSYGAGSGSPGLNFGFNLSNQSAADALVKVDGVTFSRPSNTLTDVVPGVTLNLKATTSSAANLDLTRDNTAIKDKITALVSAYNDAVTIFNEVSDPKSSLATYGATLVGDSTVRLVKTQLRSMMTGPSSTPSGSVAALWQLGVSIDQTGAMSVDNTKLDAALTNNYDDVVKAFTGNQNGLSIYSPAPAGIAGDMVKKLTTMLGKTGMLVSQSNSATAQNTKYKDNLTKLNTRMDALLVRYQKQFASMDSLVGNVNSQKTSLKSTFDGMMASLTGKNG
jgi:flagellar hook-associated protein 2